MKRILIPTDFSPHAQHTLGYVLDLMEATSVPCQILLLNTYMVQQTDPQHVIRMNDELKHNSAQKLAQEKTEALAKVKNPHISIETVSQMGSLTNVIFQLLQREKIDMVAMGKNVGNHQDKIARLLEQESCPVLLTHR
jgi:nucleotide-binding universal stress UspA family protein